MQVDLTSRIKKLRIAERILLVEEIWDKIARRNDAFILSRREQADFDRRSKSFTRDRRWEEIEAEP